MSRDVSFDIAKGFAIICVILGHSEELGVPTSLVKAIFTFHMPLFFIVSGYFTRQDVVLNRAYVMRCARSTLLPYAITCAIVLLLFAIRTLLFWPEGLADIMGTAVPAALYGTGTPEPPLPPGVTSIGAIWFLLALFWAKLFLAVVNRSPYAPVAILVLFLWGYYSGWMFWLPLSIQAGACATLFLYLGQKIRESDLLAPGRLSPLLWLVAAATWLMCINMGYKLVMASNAYPGDMVVDILGGLCGTLCVIKTSQLVARHLLALGRPLAWLGTITLPVFCMHLVEMDVFLWEKVTAWLSALPVPLWASGLALRVALIAVMCVILYFLPRPISGVFFRSRIAGAGEGRTRA